MILFSLMSTWMWFQIFTASPLLSSNRRAKDTSRFASADSLKGRSRSASGRFE